MRMLHSLAILAVLAVPVASAHATTVISDNFSGARAPGLGENGKYGAIDAYFTTIGDTNVDALSPTNFGSLCTASAYCIDLDGTTSNSGYPTDPDPNGSNQSIFQTISQLGPGTYILKFDLTGSLRGNTTLTTVTLGDYNQTFTLASSQVVHPTAIVTVTGAGDYLTFTSGQGGSAGSLLNTVSVTTTPEPSSIALLGTGLLGMAGVARRKFFKA